MITNSAMANHMMNFGNFTACSADGKALQAHILLQGDHSKKNLDEKKAKPVLQDFWNGMAATLNADDIEAKKELSEQQRQAFFGMAFDALHKLGLKTPLEDPLSVWMIFPDRITSTGQSCTTAPKP